MKITSVKPILLSAPYGTPGDTELKRAYPLGKRSAAFVLVGTDEGVTGLGETYSGVFVPELAAQLLEAFGEKIVGRDPFAVHEIRGMLTRYASYWGYTGFATNVISAVEIALWDLKGKALGVPVYELLGGARTEEIDLYASGGLDKSLGDLARELAGYVEAGFRAVKIRDRDFQIDFVRQSREAIGGDAELIVDANQSFSPRPAKFAQAIRYAERIAKYDVAFLEEPLAVDDVTGYRRMVERAPMPISGGETLNSAALFRERINGRAFDIVQPDASVIGGIAECLEVLTYAEMNGLTGVCHAWASAPCQAANVHAAFAAGSRLLEWAMPPNPLRAEMLLQPWRIENGRLHKPTAPGLGIGLSDELIKRFPYQKGTASPGPLPVLLRPNHG